MSIEEMQEAEDNFKFDVEDSDDSYTEDSEKNPNNCSNLQMIHPMTGRLKMI